MKQLDLNVFEIMDLGRGYREEFELTRDVVDAFYDGMPDAIGFVNRYAPSYTFTVREEGLYSPTSYISRITAQKPMRWRTCELAAMNTTRPYFLLVHVRQWSDIRRVKGILDKLGPEFEVVPLDLFLKMAGTTPTFKERFLVR
jgi:hypothetical protein